MKLKRVPLYLDEDTISILKELSERSGVPAGKCIRIILQRARGGKYIKEWLDERASKLSNLK